MQYIVLVIVLLALLIAKGIYDNKTYEKKLSEKIAKRFGKISEEEFSAEKLKSLSAYYNATSHDKTDLDAITWNDLEFDDFFQCINQTESAVGEEYLYALLHKPQFDENELLERERLITFFQKKPEKRLKVQCALAKIGKKNRFSIYSCMETMKELKRENNTLHYIPSILVLFSIGIFFLSVYAGILCLIGSVIFSFMTYFKRKGELDAYLNTIASLVLMLYTVDDMKKLSYPELTPYMNQLKEMEEHFKDFKKHFFILGSSKPTGDLLDSIMMYVRMMFHVDLIKFNRMLKTYDLYREELLKIYSVVGYMDSMIAIASFRQLMGTWCVPEFTKDDKPEYTAEGLYHPMLENPVQNSISTRKSVLLTGSNASGKSTFLKAVAINAVLAQTFHTVLAESYRASLFQVLSSMALRDNMKEKESYFIVEIKSLRRMFDAAKEPVFTLCFVDEVLRGTNTVERIAASREVLSGLAGDKTMVFAATHDIELTYLLENTFANYHFEEQVRDKDVTFDFLMHEGRAVSRNAIKLLRMLGYPDEVIDHAEQTAEKFLQTGKWE